MRKIIVLSFISLDGIMQAPGGPDEDTSSGFPYGGWTVPYSDEVSNKLMGEQMSVPFDLLLGRKTYDIFAAYWPKQSLEVQPTGPFNTATKYVVSRSQPELTWDKSVLMGGDIVAKLKELKQQDGPMLQVHGSGNLVQTLLKEDLVDELWLKTFPVILGKGKPFFTEAVKPGAFEIIESTTTPAGVIFASYKRAGDVKTGSFV